MSMYKIILVAISFLLMVPSSFAQDTLATDSIANLSDSLIDAQWYMQDPELDDVPGVGAYRALEYMKGKKSETVIVAIIDSGVDEEHQDMSANMWINTDEIPGNGIDDDNNGYIDDIHGWNFLGNAEGENVDADTYEFTRLYAEYMKKYRRANPRDLDEEEKKEYELYQELKEVYNEEFTSTKRTIDFYENMQKQWKHAKKTLDIYFKDEEYEFDDVLDIEAKSEGIQKAKSMYILCSIFGFSDDNDTNEFLENQKKKLQTRLNTDFDPRGIVGDDYKDIKDSIYGNNDYMGGDGDHGTAVAGVIAAMNENGVGINGIAPDVRIMTLRVVPDGDERDKDVALAIRYAVNNGAKIINCSFGKAYSPQKEFVDEAIEYAEKHGVLIIHAAGNDALNNDEVTHFPVRDLESGRAATNVLEVGASTDDADEDLLASFTNYGRESVDLFAPGQDIMTLKPGDEYDAADGTSFASPIAAGVAALVWSYFPDLTAQELKAILMESATYYGNMRVEKPGSGRKKRLKKLCITGGVINAYNAVKLAEQKANGTVE